jgi:hypothetical protein
MSRFTDGNLLAPLVFTEGEIANFLKRNRCAMCGGALASKPADNRTWNAFCPVCEQPIMAHNYITIYVADQVKQGELAGGREMRQEAKPRDPEEILKDIGY